MYMNKLKPYQIRYKSMLQTLLFVVGGVGVLVHALWDGLHVYQLPGDLLLNKPVDHVYVGGVVKPGSLSYGEQIFSLAHESEEITVHFHTPLPPMVREQHAAVVVGSWNGHYLDAARVYAKHDEYYRETNS